MLIAKILLGHLYITPTGRIITGSRHGE